MLTQAYLHQPTPDIHAALQANERQLQLPISDENLQAPARLLRGESLPDALAGTAAAMYAVIDTTVRLGRYELALVAAQDELLAPSRMFPAERL